MEVESKDNADGGSVPDHARSPAKVLPTMKTPVKTEESVPGVEQTLVTPPTEKSNLKSNDSEDEEDDPDDIYLHDNDDVKTRIVTKTIENDETGTKKTIRKVERIQYSTKPPVKGTLTEHGFDIRDGGKVGEVPFFITKIIRKSDPKKKAQALTLKVNSLIDYCNVVDDPLMQQVACEIYDSDLLFLHLKEIEEDDPEPVYEVFGDGQPLCYDLADITKEFKINNNCKDCYIDCCDEWRFGEYCVIAVKRYWRENQYTATLKNAYAHFVAHYNRALDWHSFGENPNRLRRTQVTKPPFCMRKGSLRHAIAWIKWKIEFGPHKEWYATERAKRRKLRAQKEADNNTVNEFKKSAYRYR